MEEKRVPNQEPSKKPKNIGKIIKKITRNKMAKRSKKYKEDYLYKRLQNSKEAAAYLNECLTDEDPAVFLIALKT